MLKTSFGVFVISVVVMLTLLDVNVAMVMNVREFKAPVSTCFDPLHPYMDMVKNVSRSVDVLVI